MMGLKWRDTAWYDGSAEIPTRRRIGLARLRTALALQRS
jgi:hypothetical protein